MFNDEDYLVGNKETLRKRFCKDWGLPIGIYSDPYFEERIELMDAREDWNTFTSLIHNFFHDNISEYLDAYDAAMNAIIAYIKESDAWNAMQEDPDILMKNPSICGQRELYKECNVGDVFLSIDMNKANFSALVCYGKATGKPFHDAYDWDSFVRKIVDGKIADVIIKSKHVRQVVFGKCNSKRQVGYEKWLMNTLAEHLIDENLIKKEWLFSLNSDEIILKANEISTSEAEEIMNAATKWSTIFVPTKTEWFILGRLDGTEAYVKMPVTGYGKFQDQKKPTLKCVNPLEAPFVYRFMKNEHPKSVTDTVFLLEGKRMAKLLDIPKISMRMEKIKGLSQEKENQEGEMDR